MGGSPDRARRRWTLGLRGRTALAMIVAVATACAALTITTTGWAATAHREQQERDLRTAVSRELDRERTGLFAALAENPDARTLEELVDAGWRAEDTIGLGILIPLESQTAAIDPAMALQYSFINSMEPVAERYPDCLRPDWWPTGSHMAETATIWSESCGPYLLAYAFAQPGTGLAVGKPWLVIQALYLPDEDDPVPALRTTLLLWSAVIVAGSVLLSLTLAHSLIRPVTRAGEMATAVARGDLSVRIPVRGTDAIAVMSQAVNTMADRLTDKITDLEQANETGRRLVADLEHANETGRRFVSDVAHELRTPTTTLLASAEALQDPATRNEAALLIAPQLRRLAALTENLLEISRMDAGHAELVTNSIDIVDLIGEVIADAGVVVSYHGPTELTTTTDPVRLQTILRNLLTNAVQHGAPPLTIGLTHVDPALTVTVHDGGPGVPPDLRDRVFDRFARGDESRHGTSSGLGLAIAAENARLLGGTLTVERDGSTFRLTLPTDGLAPQPRLRDPLGATT